MHSINSKMWICENLSTFFVCIYVFIQIKYADTNDRQQIPFKLRTMTIAGSNVLLLEQKL